MSPSPAAYPLYLGAAIAAKTVTYAWLAPGQRPERAFTLPQGPSGFAKLHDRLTATGHDPGLICIVLEATSTYWIRLARFLYEAGYAVWVINPKQGHDFAKALRQPGKSAALDAQGLARFAAQMAPPLWTPPPAVYHELGQRLSQRDALLKLQTALRNQLHALDQQAVVVAAVRARQVALLDSLAQPLAALDAELEQVVRSDPAWGESIARVQEVPGIGPVTALHLVVATLNFTTTPSPEAATRFAGLQPQPYSSGTSVHKRERIGRAGAARLRSALYIAAWSAVRCNPPIRAMYQRLVAAGKAKQAALCACARKLLHLAWTLVRKQRRFDPTYGQAAEQVAA